MRPGRRRSFVLTILGMLLAFGLGVEAAKKRVDPALYVGAEPAAAGEALLVLAAEAAGKGSWENIGVGRVYYLAGRPDDGQRFFDRALASDRKAGDYMRIGRVYYQAGEWPKAKELFQRVVEMKPKDEDWLAEIGAYHNLQGERDQAEAYFRRSFDLDPDNTINLRKAAASYLGVQPD